jgi:hypothetical protein
MDIRIRFDGGVSMRTPKVSPLWPSGLARELAEQVEILADEPSQSVTYSDLYDHLRNGVRHVRRLLPIWTAHAAR